MRRIISFILACVMSVTLCGLASAEEVKTTKLSQATELLTKMDILDGDFDDFDGEAKRGFTVGTAAKMISTDITTEYTNKYSDVTETTPYMQEIMFMSDMGYIDGYDNGKFFPDGAITYAEFSKMMVKMLGYDINAQAYGSYPQGYIKAMSALDIYISGKNAASKITNGEMIVCMYDALMVVNQGIVSVKWNVPNIGDTDSILEKRKVFKLTGVVTDVCGASTGYDTARTRKDEMKIDDYLLKVSSGNSIEYLGKTVTAYVRETGDAEYELLSVVKVKYENEITIQADADNAINWTRNSNNSVTLKYYDSNKQKKKTLPATAMYYYNGRLTTDYDVIDEAFGMTQGSIRILETSENTYIFFNEYFDIVVAGIDTEKGYLSDSLVYGKIKIPVDVSNAFVGVHTDEGDVSFNDISKGDTVSVFKSIDGSYVDMYVHNEKISGTLTSKNGNKYVVEGTEYELGDGVIQAIANGKKTFGELKINDSVTFSLDKFGRVADVELSRNDVEYAYMFKATILNDPEYEDYAAVFRLYNVENGETANYFAKNTVRVNGVKYKNASDAQTKINDLISDWGSTEMLVKVKYSSENEVSAIEIPIKNSSDTDRLRWAANYDDTTPEEITRIAGKWIYDANTLILEVYEGEETVEKRATKYLQQDFTKTHNYELYDPDELDFVGAMVLRVKSGFEMDNSGIYYGAPVYVVDSIKETWQEDEGESARVIVAYADGGTTPKELVVTTDKVYNIDTNIDTVFKDSCYNVPMVDGVRHGQYGYKYLSIDDIKKGDMIQVEYDVMGKVNRFRVLARLSELDGYFDNLAFGGRINNPYSMLTYGEISYMNNRAIVLDYTGNKRTYITENVPVVIYNKTLNSVTSGSMADIVEGAKAIVRAKKFKLDFVMIVEE